MRISPYTIAFARPNAAKDMFTVGKGFRKTNFYWVFPPPENPDIFTEIREWKHAQMKRFAVTPYSLNTMQKMVPVIDEVQDLLQEKLDGFAGQACDLGDWLHYFAFDVSWIDPLAWLRRPSPFKEVRGNVLKLGRRPTFVVLGSRRGRILSSLWIPRARY